MVYFDKSIRIPVDLYRYNRYESSSAYLRLPLQHKTYSFLFVFSRIEYVYLRFTPINRNGN